MKAAADEVQWEQSGGREQHRLRGLGGQRLG